MVLAQRHHRVEAAHRLDLGPLNGYLILAPAAIGETHEPAERAEAAVAQAEEWGFTTYVEWLLDQRRRLGF